MANTDDQHRAAFAIDWQQALVEHAAWLRSVIGARLGETQAVEEVWQEVSLAAWRAGPAELSPAKVAPWLYRVAVRQALLYRRAAGRRRKLVERLALSGRIRQEGESESTGLEWLLKNERAMHVRQALDALHPRDREILQLKYEHGWSYRDIGARLGISETAIEARLHRARQRLRQQWQRQEP